MRQQNKEQDMLREIGVGLLSDTLIYGVRQGLVEFEAV